MKLKKYLIISAAFFGGASINAQANANDLQLNSITTAVPILMVAPDSRAGAMGETGVATSADVNSIHWNPAKMSFIDDNNLGSDLKPQVGGVSLSYIPWLRKIVDDINLITLTGFAKVDDKLAIGGGLKYFSLGKIQYTDDLGNNLNEGNPNEFALDAAASYKLSPNFSLGLGFRYIYSNLTQGYPGAQSNKAGQSFAADVSLYYIKRDINVAGFDADWAIGMNASNIGSKMQYSNSDKKNFIPMNLRLGTSFTMHFDDYNKLTFAVDANKLLVPTPPVYRFANDTTRPADEIVSGKDPDVTVVQGIFQSFGDAPGVVTYDPTLNTYSKEKNSTFKEELSEIQVSLGLEYWYNNQFAVRAGYFHESKTKGDRQFMTLGGGAKFKMFQLDVSYLIAFKRTNPLANTLRFSLIWNIEKGAFSNKGE